MSVLHNSLVNILPFKKLDANTISLGYETWKKRLFRGKERFSKKS